MSSKQKRIPIPPLDEELDKCCAQYRKIQVSVLTQLREMCKLTILDVSLHSGIDRSTLTHSENPNKSVHLRTYVKILSWYILYMKNNNIQCKEELQSTDDLPESLFPFLNILVQINKQEKNASDSANNNNKK